MAAPNPERRHVFLKAASYFRHLAGNPPEARRRILKAVAFRQEVAPNPESGPLSGKGRAKS
jgi:hypothetical protein